MRKIVTIMLFCMSALLMQAQITIGGSVYGGGNAGDTDGSTSVTVYAGDLNEVYGGARMANVGGASFVHIDGEHASDNIFINSVYGGNDIAGTVGTDNTNTDPVPAELTEVGTEAGKNAIDNSWDAYIRTSPTPVTASPEDRKSLVIGSLFGGGNGDYGDSDDDNKYITGDYIGKDKPVLGKTYLEILGGCIAHLYGGGNNATVTGNTTICINNNSPVLTETNVMPILPENPTTDQIATYRAQLAALAQRTGLSTFQSNLTSYAFNFARIFGGNNKAPMAIRPVWNLQAGIIRDLYSGGNQGAMTSPNGILLSIKPEESEKLTIENVFGGCRMADVNPAKNTIAEETIDGTYYPAGYSARVLITGGDITNVYGGNDISGNIYGGNAVGIHSSIKGDVYGGGNGSYAYTDNDGLKDDPNYGDFYYSVAPGLTSADALRKFRPNAESVSLRLVGTENKPTIIGGAVYCGGNSATLHNDDPTKNAAAELKIGSYVIADKVFLGNNGANMVAENMLKQYAGTVTVNELPYDFSQMDLTDETKDTNGQTQFDKYMDGVTMDVMPRVTFDSKANGDPLNYKPYSSMFGSFYCGGNVGSMKINGAIEVSFNDTVIIYEKLVGGSNEANIPKTDYNSQYLGGLLGSADTDGNKLILNLNGLKMEPRRWVVERDANYDIIKDADGNPTYIPDSYGNRQLEWNTVSASSAKEVAPVTTDKPFDQTTDLDRRLKGGNIYGGCYNNGHVEGNVVINLNATLHERNKLFDVTDEGDILYENSEQATYNISKRNTGVILSEQGMDVFGSALNVFGGGYGSNSEIWGSTTINLNKGYTFQIFGGGEAGAIGQANSYEPDPNNSNALTLDYAYDEKYSTYINLNGDAQIPGVARGAAGDNADMAECEFIYGGAFEGPIAGNTHINLNNGRLFNTFAGSCNANILGHTETYVGRNGFPFIRDHIYGGNDLGGKIEGSADFTERVRDEVKEMVNDACKEQIKNVTSYMEYTQGRVGHIFGGSYGNYDYEDDTYKTRITNKPYLHNAFVNIRSNTNANNKIDKVFGAGEGCSGDRDGDQLQDHSYVLIDIPEGIDNFADTEIFGAGAYDGLGMRWTPEETFDEDFNLDEASATIDLMRGHVSAAYGGSYEEGITRRTVVNVPQESSINITNIFGGAYGTDILPPCDVYESNVNYLNTSEKALVTGAIYGGNNNERRTVYAHVNIFSPVWSNKDKGYLANVYGAGKGLDTWSEYTEVNLEDGAKVYEVYGGGEMGHVLNAESVQKYMQSYVDEPSSEIAKREPWNNQDRWEGGTVGGTLKSEWRDAWKDDWRNAWTFGEYYKSLGEYTRYVGNAYMNLNNQAQVRTAEMDDRDHSGLSDELKARIDHKYNANVLIKKGATVVNYAYGGGWGEASTPLSGDVYGTTYIALLGGTVNKDIYASGTAGGVYNLFGAENFTANANAYILGGMARNVYGGGWRGSVGYNKDFTSTDGDILAESHVVVGKTDGTSFFYGVPAIKRNVYGGGEGGGIYGTAYVTINNGRIGYRYEDETYKEELDDVKEGDNLLDESGNVFGGGYVANSYVDVSDVKVFGGVIRGGLYGGGEVGPIGRGTVKEGAPAPNGTFVNGLAKIYKAGETHVTLYKGHVMRDVFGGGRGYDNWGGEGYMTETEKLTMDLSSKGYVFGSTDVHILGGEVGTTEGVAKGYGNVFGGGNVGYVYSAKGKKDDSDGYYRANGELTEDCRVNIEACGIAKEAVLGVEKGGIISNATLNTLTNGSSEWSKIDQEGVTIHNAVFAGGNVSVGSNDVFAFSKTVFGNATASVIDVFCRDLISVGGDGIGGIYGDGNLTYVDGYRELNISNYGTDFYALPSSMDLTDPAVAEEYNKLTDRQKAIYVVKYKFDGHPDGNVNGLYEAGDVIMTDEYKKLTDLQKTHWTAIHSVINEGRYINTIQRCDFCGIIGSRLVLRGAMDRAQENITDQADYTNYTINRVGELSLNQWHSLGEGVAGDVTHGCYFGIYNVVKLLGAVTSDVKFDDIRETGSTLTTNREADGCPTYGTSEATYWKWKQVRKKDNNLNNGSSWNKIALASGVFLEIVKNIKDNGDKEYGPITGIVELDLLNVTPGEGGGYVYAENIHGERTIDEAKAIASVLSDANKAQGGCRTNAGYSYDQPGTNDDLQTSGNFVSSLKDIVDDCFPTSKSWMPGGAPAHYWYIRGEFYVYDQEVSAYTGSADAYSAEISIPMTMVAQSNARLRILNVLPGLYADPTQFDPDKSSFDADLNTWKSDSLEIAYDNVTKRFGQNDPISYWDWYMTNKANQSRFVTETYCCNEQITVNGVTYYPGQGILPATYNSLQGKSGVNAYGEVVENAQEKFGSTNGMNHDNGFVLTLDMTNPSKWNDYYTALSNRTDKMTTYEWNKLTTDQQANYIESATFHCDKGGTYGQYYFTEGDIISQTIHDMQTNDVTSHAASTQASFGRAYIAADSCEVTIEGQPRIMQRNATISANTFSSLSASDKAHFKLAKVCGSTFSVSDKELYVLGQVVAEDSPIATNGAYATNFTDAWYCTSDGSWGGLYYEEGKNYTGVEYCQLLPEEREHFSYNYDALDLLVTDFRQKNGTSYPTKEELALAGTEHNHQMVLYDGTNSDKLYSVPVRIDYDAIYKGSINFTYKDDNGKEVTVADGTKLESVDYQNLPNDFAHYATIHVNDNHKITDETDADKGKYVVYVVMNSFDVGGTMFNAGKVISKNDYDGLGTLQSNVEKVVMTAEQQSTSSNGVFYYCIDPYTVGEKDQYVVGYTSPALTDIDNNVYDVNQDIELGTIISSSKMTAHNYQKDFEVSGDIPMEQTTLYVPISANYDELQKDRYITVIFEYTYTESDAQGLNFETRVEKHILNLRVKFKSGKPLLGKLKEPDYVLPLESVNIGIPFIQESANAFPIMKGGFEIYDNESDALKHRNGREFTNGAEPVYFYEDMNYVSYYAETRLGRTFCDPVPIHVANYHRMNDVINNPEHMYINHRNLKRNPKIYIDGRTVSGQSYNELDAMKEMFDLVNGDYGRVANDNTEKNHGRDIQGAKGLDFFVQNDVAASRPWTSIGDDSHCFMGNFHGNGHTLSNMSASLFGKLCGNVYNTGVMGNFTGGGIADSGEGRIENAWVSTTGTPTGKAIIATPAEDAVIINSYYPETQAFTPHDESVDVTKRSDSDFRNGRVAYDLNRYYLEARYNLFTKDENVSGNPVKNDSVLFLMPDGTLEQETAADGETYPVTHGLFYTNDYAWHSGNSTINANKKYGYVESLYEDGDFRFADGLKPHTADLRLSQYAGYLPIFPDDYIFFGQRLSYGLYSDRPHDDVPMGAVKDHTITTETEAIDNSRSGLLTNNTKTENRIYRAPAYFRNGTLDKTKTVVFNANAAFTDTYNGYNVYKNMTAIDFTGANGDINGTHGVVQGAKTDFTSKADGYGPLLDFIRIDNLRTRGLTQNLLVYAPDVTIDHTMNANTAEKLKGWSGDPTFAEGEADPDYHTVAVQDESDVKGHVVLKSGTGFLSAADHLLVDKQDFNAPIAYQMGEDYRMWYQRKPDNFVAKSNGWEAVSLPFTAEMVTTQDKGELTHFYEGSEKGHEYWLREYKGGDVSTTEENTFVATMNKPEAGTENKDYTNTYLWEYYYSKDNYQDFNADQYQKYYSEHHTYKNYPRLAKGTPYIIGFPGAYYYEFDLSGEWEPVHRYQNVTIENPGKQTITFASKTNATIGVSDAEQTSGKVTENGYTFVPTYLAQTLEAEAGYLLNADGNSFTKNTQAATTVPFRPYFVTAAGGNSKKRVVGRIVFDMSDTSFAFDDNDPSKSELGGELRFYTKKHLIGVESSLRNKTDVRIVNTSGLTIASFTIQPGETIETPVPMTGVYIIHAAGGKYIKKIAVK